MFPEPIIPPIEKIVKRYNLGISCPEIFDKAVIPIL
jgi:hypothetical protein